MADFKFAVVVIAFAANCGAIFLLLRATISYRNGNYNRSVAELMFCIALALIFQFKVGQ